MAPKEKETSKKKSEKHILTRWCTSRQQKLAKETRRTRQSTASAKHRLKHASRACNPGTVEGAWGFSTPYPYPTIEGYMSNASTKTLKLGTAKTTLRKSWLGPAC